jgi:hypothetical protein
LHVFDAHQGVGVVLVVRQSSFGSGHVQFNQFFNTGKSFVAHAEKGVNAGFVSGNHLFCGHHGVFPLKSKSVEPVSLHLIFVAAQHE